MLDNNEFIAKNAKITIYRNGKLYRQGLSDEFGEFAVKAKPGGVYCVKVDTSSIDTSNMTIDSTELISKSAFANNHLSLPSASPTDSNTTTSSKDNNNDQQDNNSTSNSTTHELGWTDNGYCSKLKWDLDLQLPIGINYKSAFLGKNNIPTTICYTGADCRIITDYPAGCYVLSFDVPQGFTLDAAHQRSSAKSLNPSINVPQLNKGYILLHTPDTMDDNHSDFNFKLSIDCPDNQEFSKTYPISLENNFNILVSQGFERTDEIDILKVNVRLESIGKSSVKHGKLLFDFPSDVILIESYDSCIEIASSTQCTIKNFKYNDLLSYDFYIKLPEPRTPYNIKSTFTESHTQKSFKSPDIDLSFND